MNNSAQLASVASPTRALAAGSRVLGAVDVVFHDFKRGGVLIYKHKAVSATHLAVPLTWTSCMEAMKSSPSSSSSMNFPQTASCSNLFSDINIRNNVKGIKISSLIKSLIVLLYVIKSQTINYLLLLSGPSCFLMPASSWVMSTSSECISPTRLCQQEI